MFTFVNNLKNNCMNEARKESSDKAEIMEITLQKMNAVIDEFKKELSHKIHKSYEIFFFDPTADDFYWDSKE